MSSENLGPEYFEDLVLDQEMVIGRHHVTKEEIVRFATEWDPQPFHIDEGAAAVSVFGGLTASSCHTYALTARIFHDAGRRLRTVAMLGMDETRFPNPVRPDDDVVLTQTILELRRSASRPQLGVIKSVARLRSRYGEPDETLQMSMVTNFLVEARSL